METEPRIEFSLNNELMREQMSQKIILMLIKIVFEDIKRGISLASSKSPFIQVLHQQIMGGWGVLVCADSADTV